MLDGLLRRGFCSKCKLLIKATRTRIDVLRTRQEATQRFLKGILVNLLATGHDVNAYGRTEEFLAGENVLSCYDFLNWCCEFILKHLSVMQKQRAECPEECRESIGSLMFAAARFPDMPELGKLRDLFQERYGTSLEHFVTLDFAEKIASNPPTEENKLQFLQGIALESSIKWDCKYFQKMLESSATAGTTHCPVLHLDQPRRLEPACDPDKHKQANGKGTFSNGREYSYLNHDRNSDEHGEKSMRPHCLEKGLTLPNPGWMRKKHYSQSDEDVDIESSSNNNNNCTSSQTRLQILFKDENQQNDEEERMLDKLLLHYSRKPSNFDPKSLIKNPSNHKQSSIPPPRRTFSLPNEKTGRVEPVKVYAREHSIQPNHQPGNHVHPKLPITTI